MCLCGGRDGQRTKVLRVEGYPASQRRGYNRRAEMRNVSCGLRSIKRGEIIFIETLLAHSRRAGDWNSFAAEQ